MFDWKCGGPHTIWKSQSSITIRKRIPNVIQKWQQRESDNLGYTRRNKTKQKHNTMYVGHHYAQTGTINAHPKAMPHGI